MKKLNISILALVLVVVLGACKKSFLDVNNNPNNPTQTSVAPNTTLAAALNGSASKNASSYDFLNRWLGYWSASGSFSRATVEMSYNITNDFGSGIWNGTYGLMANYRSIEDQSRTRGWDFYRGISIAMQSHEMQTLVDIYGNVPYSKALDFSGNISPAYDNAEDIYKNLMVRLDTAIMLIKNAPTGVDQNIASQDIIFKGDKTSWAKFINTLKLRLLIHTSQTSTFNVASEIAKITSEGSGFLGANSLGAMAQPGYTNDKPNPYYAAHLHAQNGNEADNYNRANVFTLNLMNSLQDPRRTRQYRLPKTVLSPRAIRGTIYGSNASDDVNSDRTSGPGYGLIQVADSVFSTPPTATAATGSSQPMWVMSSVEAMFLVAEATIRGWIPGTAKTAYEDAVRESFRYLTLTTAQANTYLAGTDPKVAWPTAGGQAAQLSVLAWQKYFALNGLQANETWVDIRRLDVVQPALSIAPERGSNPIPVRLLYPTSEYNFNKTNVGTQGTVSQFTSKIFWDK